MAWSYDLKDVIDLSLQKLFIYKVTPDSASETFDITASDQTDDAGNVHKTGWITKATGVPANYAVTPVTNATSLGCVRNTTNAYKVDLTAEGITGTDTYTAQYLLLYVSADSV